MLKQNLKDQPREKMTTYRGSKKLPNDASQKTGVTSAERRKPVNPESHTQ